MSFTDLVADVFPRILVHLEVSEYMSLLGTSKGLYEAMRHAKSWQESHLSGNDALRAIFEEGRNVLLTGPGGCGKTTTIKRIVTEATKRGWCTQVVSTTGVSAAHLSTTTIHSFFGMRTYKNIDAYMKSRGFPRSSMSDRLAPLRLVVIDEVSMLGQKEFELLDFILRTYRKNDAPMGGVQLVFSGDFYQLPPVRGKRVFRSPVWDSLRIKTVSFEVSVRHRYDPSYFRVLQRVRKGTPSREDFALLRTRALPLEEGVCDGIRPIILVGTNAEAEDYNATAYVQVSTPSTEMGAYDVAQKYVRVDGTRTPQPTGEISVGELRTALAPQLHKYPDVLRLKPGAQYYITYNQNIAKGVVNGAPCTFLNIQGQLVYVRLASGLVYGLTRVVQRFPYERDGHSYALCRMQFPLTLGYAMTVHYSQGATLPKAFVDCKRVRTGNQLYVAISRVSSLEDLYLSNIEGRKTINAAREVKEFYDRVSQ